MNNIQSISEYSNQIYVAMAALLSSVLTYLSTKKHLSIKKQGQTAMSESILVENIQTLMKNHSDLYTKVLTELEEAKGSKMVLEEQYRRELAKGVERDRLISRMEIEIESLKREISILKNVK